PIPNTEVKPSSADGTALATVRESRSLPEGFFIFVAAIVMSLKRWYTLRA
ncbi:MAG: hypothetical protein PWR07_1706, partial [Bacillota bacterium]|nr:hypothetical protein [Bacillota bacterium]